MLTEKLILFLAEPDLVLTGKLILFLAEPDLVLTGKLIFVELCLVPALSAELLIINVYYFVLSCTTITKFFMLLCSNPALTN